MRMVVKVKTLPPKSKSQTDIIVFIAENVSFHRSAFILFLLFDFQKQLLKTQILFSKLTRSEIIFTFLSFLISKVYNTV